MFFMALPSFASEQGINSNELEDKINLVFKRCQKNILTNLAIYQPSKSLELTQEWNNFLFNYNWNIEESTSISLLADTITLNSLSESNSGFSSSSVLPNYFYPELIDNQNNANWNQIKNKINQRRNHISLIEKQAGMSVEDAAKSNSIPESKKGYYTSLTVEKYFIGIIASLNSDDIQNKIKSHEQKVSNYINQFKKFFINNERSVFLINSNQKMPSFIDECGNLFVKNDNLFNSYKHEIFYHEAGHILLNLNSSSRMIKISMNDTGVFNIMINKLLSSNIIKIEDKDRVEIKNFTDNFEKNMREITNKLIDSMHEMYNHQNRNSNDEILIDALSITKMQDDYPKYLNMIRAFVGHDSERYKFLLYYSNLNKKIMATEFKKVKLVPYFSFAQGNLLKLAIISKMQGNMDIGELVIIFNNSSQQEKDEASLIIESLIDALSGKSSSFKNQLILDDGIDLSFLLELTLPMSLDVNTLDNIYSDILNFKSFLGKDLKTLSSKLQDYQISPFGDI